MSHRILLLSALLALLAIFIATPALIAAFRGHPERRLIYRLTPLTVASFILWFVLLAWAVTGVRDDALISRCVAKLRRRRHLPLMIGALVVVGMAGGALTLFR